MLRRLFILTACFAALLAASMALLPWWLGPVLARLGRAQDATFGSYERIGYARFALNDIEVRRAGVQVKVARVEADSPIVWLWHRWTGRPAEIIAGKWTVVVENQPRVATATSAGTDSSRERSTAAPVTLPAPSPETGGWLPLQSLLIRIAVGLEHWVPRAKTGAGKVSWLAGDLTLASVRWTAPTLEVDNLQLGSWQANGTLVLADGDALRLSLQAVEAKGTALLESRGTEISGRMAWWDQPATLAATFGARGWLPVTATLQADSWVVPGAQLKLGDLYATIRGHGKIEWRDDHFAADVTAVGEPPAGRSAPPLEATLRGRGDAQSFTIEEMHATLPGITARLSAPVTVDRHGIFQQGVARFLTEIDLAKQPWIAAQGTARGEARLVAGVARPPVVEFELEARAVTAGAFTLSQANASGKLDWPRLAVTTATITLAEGESLAGHAGWDFARRELLAATIAGTIRRGTIARWLPEQPAFDSLTLEATASGPLANLTHSGKAHAEGVQWPRLNPLALATTWRGHGGTLEDFTAEVKAGATTITATGSATRKSVTATDLSLSQGNGPLLKLTAPATITWSPALQIDSLQLAGEGAASITVMPGDSGRVELTLHQVSSAWLVDLAPLPGPAWQVNALTFSGQWGHGPMTYTGSGDVSVELGAERTAKITTIVRGDADGLQVETLRASEGKITILTATGRIPLVFSPGIRPMLRLDPKGTLVLDAATEPNGLFWARMAELSGITFQDPAATAHLTGTWAQPLGEIHLQAAKITGDPKRFPWPLPSLDALTFTATGDTHGLKLENFSANIEGQAVRAQGRLTMTADGWGELTKDPLAFARRQAEMHLQLPDVDLTAWGALLPPWLAPHGRLQADLNYTGGGSLTGSLRLQDAATRPLGAIGVLQEINAEVTLSGRKAELQRVTATAGGQPVTLSGSIDYPARGEPRFAVALRGSNLPFIRQPGLLVRGDLDLSLKSGITGPPSLGGTVRLRDSLFLSDIRSFLPGASSGGTRPPPYFSVEIPPLNTWRLDVGVTGPHFLRLRTPLFNGTASARFRLRGTLGEPRLIGEVTVDSGQVLMPFARFTVQQGSARITEAKPHEMAIFLRGTGRRYDYELAMEVTGTPEAPSVVFTSSPALDSEQLLLMVMTGVVPASKFAYSSTQRFARLGTYLGQSLLNSFGGDDVSADRLSIANGENISRQGRETYDVQYKLGDRWKLVGEYDEFDDYNIGLKWRLYPGKSKPEAPEDETK